MENRLIVTKEPPQTGSFVLFTNIYFGIIIYFIIFENQSIFPSFNNTSPMLDIEKSIQVAKLIEMLKPILFLFDVDYIKEMIKQIKKQPDNVSIGDASYAESQQVLLSSSAHSMELLLKFIDSLNKCETIKSEIKKYEKIMEEANPMFV